MDGLYTANGNSWAYSAMTPSAMALVKLYVFGHSFNALWIL